MTAPLDRAEEAAEELLDLIRSTDPDEKVSITDLHTLKADVEAEAQIHNDEVIENEIRNGG